VSSQHAFQPSIRGDNCPARVAHGADIVERVVQDSGELLDEVSSSPAARLERRWATA
jgi:hypothetical protein